VGPARRSITTRYEESFYEAPSPWSRLNAYEDDDGFIDDSHEDELGVAIHEGGASGVNFYRHIAEEEDALLHFQPLHTTQEVRKIPPPMFSKPAGTSIDISNEEGDVEREEEREVEILQVAEEEISEPEEEAELEM
jgi:hypothetical protein